MLLRNETISSLRKCIQDHSTFDDQYLIAPCQTSIPDESLSQAKLLRDIDKRSNLATSGSSNPWKINPRYFSSVLISKLACSKVIDHALRGGDIEIMGMLVGTTSNDQFVVFDSFELPVEGTETRVNAQTESYEYMVQYVDEMLPSNQNIVGWYHSHPGYDCWLSSVDMHTQQLNQNFQDPYLAIVVDPHKSLKEHKLCIGAFRTIQGPITEQDEELLEFYELNVSIFDSNLNTSLDSSKLKCDAPKFDTEIEAVLISKLLDTMRQWNTFDKMSHGQQSHESPNNETIRTVTEESWGPLEKIQISGHSQQPDSLFRRTRSNSFFSVASNGNESDVDMDSRQLGDMDSVSSSIHTVTEPSAPVMGRQPQMPLPSLRKIWASSSQEMSFSPRTEKMVREIEDEAEAVQNETLRADYVANKKELLGLKFQEYEQLRFFKDTFTL